MTPFEILGLVLAATSGVGWVNKRFFGLPSSVGLLAAGLLAGSALLVAADRVPARRRRSNVGVADAL